jgi:hypothetical protein
MAPEVDTVVTPRPERFRYTTAIPALTEKNARLARRSFEAFRRTIRPNMLWNPFVLRLTRELQHFGDAMEAGRRLHLNMGSQPLLRTSQRGWLGAIQMMIGCSWPRAAIDSANSSTFSGCSWRIRTGGTVMSSSRIILVWGLVMAATTWRNVQRTKSPRFPPGFGGVSRSVHGRDVGEKGMAMAGSPNK